MPQLFGQSLFVNRSDLFQDCHRWFIKAINLIKKAKQADLHVAIETTGNYSSSLLEEASPYIDLFLFDIKHIDHQKLKSVTGMNPELVFHNFEQLATSRPDDIIARVPVIPGFNLDDLPEIIHYLSRFNVKVNLLPFHNLGKAKWQQLHRDYQFDHLNALDPDDLKQYVNDHITIGG